MNEVNLSKEGTYTAKVSGKLTIHGVTKDVETTALFTVKGGSISAKSDFKVLLTDYNIEIPSLVKDKLAREATISIDVNYEILKTS